MDYHFLYVIVGLIYWSYNLLFRKLHTKNEAGEGWILTPFWLLMWPLCFLMLGIGKLSDWVTHKKHEYTKF